MLSTVERRQEIVVLANHQGKVKVPDLSDKFKVSTVTIRNDLNSLAKKGLLVRARGGAIASTKISKELSVEEKHHENHDVKVAIGKEAAKLINHGESIILDSGTTTEQIAKCLGTHKDLVVMTNGLNITVELSHFDDIETLVTGGKLRKRSLSFYGSHAEESLKNLRFDKVFLGVDGIDTTVGLTTHFEHEANLNRIMVDSSREVIAVTDSSKFNKNGFQLVASMISINTLITDDRIPEKARSEIESYGIKLITVPYPKR